MGLGGWYDGLIRIDDGRRKRTGGQIGEQYAQVAYFRNSQNTLN